MEDCVAAPDRPVGAPGTVPGSATALSAAVPAPRAFTARTWNLYRLALSKLTTEWVVVSAPLPGMVTQAGVVSVKAPSSVVRRNCQLVMAKPPSLLAVHDSVTILLPGNALSERGRPGVVPTVTGSDSACPLADEAGSNNAASTATPPSAAHTVALRTRAIVLTMFSKAPSRSQFAPRALSPKA